MKRTLTSIVLATLFANICTLVSGTVMAQSEQQARPNMAEVANSVESQSCPDAQKFSYGSGVTKFSFCISEHGNILNLESPATYKHITGAEGYIACGAGFNSPHDPGPEDQAYGWNAPLAVSQPGGPHTLPLTIIRESTEVKFRLKQIFDWDPVEKKIMITMVLKNISADAITDVRLARYFDGDIDNEWNNVYDDNDDSVWGRSTSSAARHGLMLSALSLAVPHMANVETGSAWFYSKTICPTSDPANPPRLNDDYIGRLTFKLGTLNAGQSKTVKMLYKRF
jgi:hypothetical protein